MVGARVTIKPTVTLAITRFSGGKMVMAVANTAGIIAPAVRPWSARVTIIISMLVERPVRIEVAMKPAAAAT